jgi:hypothetical protein
MQQHKFKRNRGVYKRQTLGTLQLPPNNQSGLLRILGHIEGMDIRCLLPFSVLDMMAVSSPRQYVPPVRKLLPGRRTKPAIRNRATDCWPHSFAISLDIEIDSFSVTHLQ